MGGPVRVWTLAVAVLLLPTPAIGESPPLITDRPDFTESSAAVPPGHVQVELGAAVELAEESTALEAPALLVRTGLFKNVELRVGAPSVLASWVDGEDTDTDVGSLTLGTKLVLPRGSNAVGLLPFATLPVRSRHYDEVGVSVGLKAVWSVELSQRLGLGGNFGVEVSGLGAEDPVEVAWQGLGSLSLGIRLTETLGTFVEGYALFDEGQVDPYAQTGLTYSPLPRLQLDLHGGMLIDDPVVGIVGAGASLIL